ncbi:MAG TPA: hypothetical protein PKL13_02765 [bacterium]|nr:hypothetical protein [bacterium]
MNLMNLNFQYFFDAYPPIIKSHTFWTMFFVSVIVVISAFLIKHFVVKKPIQIFKKLDKYSRELFLKFYNIFITFGIINLFLLFFRKVRVPYFQARFLMIFWWAFILVWICNTLQYHLTKIPAKRIEDAKRREYEKYIK